MSGTIQSVRDVVYRDVAGDRQALNILRPSGPTPDGGRPVVIAIHGGGWRRFANTQYQPTVAPLVRRGFVVVTPNYRLSRPGAPSWPANFEAVRDAVRWVRVNADEIGADPDRIAAMGESAGGHLAALLGTYPDGPVSPEGEPPGVAAGVSARVGAVVSFYGPADLATLQSASPLARAAVRQFLGGSPETDPGRYVAASPLDHVTADDPPFLIVHGSADPLIPPSQSRLLAARLGRAGVPNQLVMVPGAGHGFGLRAGGRSLLAIVARFLTEALG